MKFRRNSVGILIKRRNSVGILIKRRNSVGILIKRRNYSGITSKSCMIIHSVIFRMKLFKSTGSALTFLDNFNLPVLTLQAFSLLPLIEGVLAFIAIVADEKVLEEF